MADPASVRQAALEQHVDLASHVRSCERDACLGGQDEQLRRPALFRRLVDGAGHAVELDDLRKVADHFGEALEPLVIVLVGGDGDEGGDFGVDPLGVEQGDTAGDDAVLLELLDAAPARCRRETNAAADFGDGDGGVLLEDLQDLAIEAVDHCRFPSVIRIRN